MKKTAIILVLILVGFVGGDKPAPHIQLLRGRIRSLETRVDCQERELAVVRGMIEDFIRSSGND